MISLFSSKYDKNTVRVSSSAVWMPAAVRERLGREKEIVRMIRFSKPELSRMKKKRPIKPSVWAEKNRFVTMSAFPGMWKNELTPYLTDIMDYCGDRRVREVTICKTPQVGGTEAIMNFVGYCIDRDPGPVLYIFPDEKTANDNSEDRIQPMIRDSRTLAGHMTGRVDDMAKHRIRLDNCIVYPAWASSPSVLANKPIKYVVFEETDKYRTRKESDKEAGPISLGLARTTTFGRNYTAIYISTPTVTDGIIWQKLIENVFFRYYVACPVCTKKMIMDDNHIVWPETERDPERIAGRDLARYQCQSCGEKWDDYRRDAAVKKGGWYYDGATFQNGMWVCDKNTDPMSIHTYMDRYNERKIGFHIPAWISPFNALSKLAAKQLAAAQQVKREKKTELLHDYYNSVKAAPFEVRPPTLAEDRFVTLVDPGRKQGVVPGGGQTAMLTAGIDTQDHGVWYEIQAIGWGHNPDRWHIRGGFLNIDFDHLGWPALDVVSGVLFRDAYYDDDGKQHYVRLSVMDAMGHRTKEVADFIMHSGISSVIIPFQGVGRDGIGRMQNVITWGKLATHPGLPLLRVDVNHFKSMLNNRLAVSAGDPGRFHYHNEMKKEGDWFAQMTAEYFDPDKRMWLCVPGRDNHAWDCTVYNLIAQEISGIAFAEQPKNTRVDHTPEQYRRAEPDRSARETNRGRVDRGELRRGSDVYERLEHLRRGR